MRFKSFLIVAGLMTALVLHLPSSAEARGKKKSPFVKTPYGMIPKSQAYGAYIRDPQKLAAMQKAEAAALQKSAGKSATAKTKKK